MQQDSLGGLGRSGAAACVLRKYFQQLDSIKSIAIPFAARFDCLLMFVGCMSVPQVIREKFDAHKDGQEGSDLRNKYEAPKYACDLVFF